MDSSKESYGVSFIRRGLYIDPRLRKRVSVVIPIGMGADGVRPAPSLVFTMPVKAGSRKSGGKPRKTRRQKGRAR